MNGVGGHQGWYGHGSRALRFWSPGPSIELCCSDELKAMEKDIRNSVQDSLTAIEADKFSSISWITTQYIHATKDDQNENQSTSFACLTATNYGVHAYSATDGCRMTGMMIAMAELLRIGASSQKLLGSQ
eukprot:gene26663-33277_t